MGQVTILNETTEYPLSLMGKCAGICYNSDTSNQEKNKKRGLNTVRAGHGRTWEFCEVYMKLDGYSARVIREFYTHIAGGPTRLQASTRYIEYGNFDYIIPPSVGSNPVALNRYMQCMDQIRDCMRDLEAWDIPKEDIANVLPLGMTTTVVVRMNARTLISMAEQRLCARAYWEYHHLMYDIIFALGQYSQEWSEIVREFFRCKCEKCGWCEEEFSCGKYPKKDEVTLVSTEQATLLENLLECGGFEEICHRYGLFNEDYEYDDDNDRIQKAIKQATEREAAWSDYAK